MFKSKMHRCNVEASFKSIATDAVGPFPQFDDVNRYVLVVIDYFLKWPEANLIPNQEATTVAEELFQLDILFWRADRAAL